MYGYKKKYKIVYKWFTNENDRILYVYRGQIGFPAYNWWQRLYNFIQLEFSCVYVMSKVRVNTKTLVELEAII